MAHYPPLAYALAIGFGKLAGSMLQGMFIVCGISFASAYIAVGELMRRRDPIQTMLSLLFFLLIAIAVRKFVALIGNEVLFNFFYAQLPGSAALILGLLLLARLRTSFLVWLAVAAVVTWLVCWFFTLSAIQLAGACTVLRAADYIGGKQDLKLTIFKALFTFAVLMAVALTHPTFHGMIRIAENDGGITITAAIIGVSVVATVIGSVLYLTFCEASRLRCGHAVLALAVGCAGCCAAQIAAYYYFGLGSPYAIKKHGFVLVTGAVALWSVLMVDIPGMRRLERRFLLLQLRLLPMVSTALFCIAMLNAVYWARPRSSVVNLVAYDRDLRALMETPIGSTLTGQTRSSNTHLSPTENSMLFGTVLRGSPATVQEQLKVSFLKEPPWNAATFVAMGITDPGALSDGCVAAKSELWIVVKTRC